MMFYYAIWLYDVNNGCALKTIIMDYIYIIYIYTPDKYISKKNSENYSMDNQKLVQFKWG